MVSLVARAGCSAADRSNVNQAPDKDPSSFQSNGCKKQQAELSRSACCFAVSCHVSRSLFRGGGNSGSDGGPTAAGAAAVAARRARLAAAVVAATMEQALEPAEQAVAAVAVTARVTGGRTASRFTATRCATCLAAAFAAVSAATAVTMEQALQPAEHLAAAFTARPAITTRTTVTAGRPTIRTAGAVGIGRGRGRGVMGGPHRSEGFQGGCRGRGRLDGLQGNGRRRGRLGSLRDGYPHYSLRIGIWSIGAPQQSGRHEQESCIHRYPSLGRASGLRQRLSWLADVRPVTRQPELSVAPP
jgi:hypothetical protein